MYNGKNASFGKPKSAVLYKQISLSTAFENFTMLEEHLRKYHILEMFSSFIKCNKINSFTFLRIQSCYGLTSISKCPLKQMRLQGYWSSYSVPPDRKLQKSYQHM